MACVLMFSKHERDTPAEFEKKKESRQEIEDVTPRKLRLRRKSHDSFDFWSDI